MSLNPVFSALSDPTRRAILERLSRGEATVKEIAKPFSISQPAISRHLKVLEEAGLISRRIEGASRPCRLREDALDGIEEWLELLRRTLSANYDRLDELLIRMEEES
ncbi:MAG: metalloregulator ArsR/SmtB family transcription factor [Gemmatimonadota bacterium]